MTDAMPETRLVLIRHGHAQVHLEGIVGGHDACRGLSELGRRQAVALHDRLAKTGELIVGALYTSVLPRAIETAEIVAPALGGLEATRDCDLCELHPGEADGLSWEEYRSRHGFDLRAEPERPFSPGGESLAGFHGRVERRLRRLLDDHTGETVAVVCHAGVISAATLAMMDQRIHGPQPFRLEPANTSITEWTKLPTQPSWVLVRFNDAGHVPLELR